MLILKVFEKLKYGPFLASEIISKSFEKNSFTEFIL